MNDSEYNVDEPARPVSRIFAGREGMTMASMQRLAGTAVVVALLAAAFVVQRAGTARPLADPAPTNKTLEHFDGTIDHGRHTLDPVRSDLYVRAARALEAGDAAAAESLYREAVAKYPADPDGYTALAACLAFQRRYAEARAEYGRALALDPKSADALYGLGCVAYEEGRDAEARDHLLAALAAREAHGGTHRMLGLVYDRLGNRAAALRSYERAAALDPAIARQAHVKRRLAELRDSEAGEPAPAPERTGGK